MAEQLPAKVRVEIEECLPCKKFNNVTVKHLYLNLLRSKEQLAKDESEYERALNDKPNASKDNNKVSNSPKYFVQNVALVGNAMIAQPQVEFHFFPARLLTTSPTLESKVSDTYSTKSVMQIGTKYIDLPLRGGSTINNWVPLTELLPDGTTTSLTSFTETDKSGIRFTNRGKVTTKRSIQSDFTLKVNQPFAVDLDMQKKFSTEQTSMYLRNQNKDKKPSTSTTENNAGTSTTVTPQEDVTLIPSTVITWGNEECSLTVYADRKLSFTYKGAQVGSRVTIPGNSNSKLFSELLVIYPLGNSVYVYTDVPSIENTTKKLFVEFALKEPVKISEGPVRFTFSCAKGAFDFFSVVHPKSAIFQSPVIKVPTGTTSTIVNTFHLGKIGVGSRGLEPPIPDTSDRDGSYEYLKEYIGEKPLELEKKSIGQGGFAYKLKLNVKKELTDAEIAAFDSETRLKESATATLDNIYSPAIFSSHFTFIQPDTAAASSAFEFDSNDILSVTVNQSVERQSATIVLDNRNFDGTPGGKYPIEDSIFTGIKPIKISMGYGSNNLKTVFTGFTCTWEAERAGPTRSTLKITCDDRSKQAREQFAVNLPFFDGWCHLGAMKYLLREAGYPESILDMPATSGSIDTFEGGCFDGHADTDSNVDDFTHAQLPLAILGVSEPCFNFSMGTPLWSCMQRVREFTNWYLYADHEGDIVFRAPKEVLSGGVKQTFVEVDEIGNFNEITNSVRVSLDTTDMRNGVYMQGQTFILNKEHPEFSNWTSHVHIKNGFPSDQTPTDAFFAPYPRMAFIRNPKFEDVNLLRANALEIFRRLARNRTTLSFSSWGQIDLHPYDIVAINESIMNETGVNGKSYVIAAHTLNADGQNHTITSQFTCENFDAGTANYDPFAVPNLRD